MTDNGIIWLVVLFAFASSKRSSVPWGSGWVWPVPPARYPDGTIYKPRITQEWRPAPKAHYGVDVMFRRRTLDDRPEDAPGSDNGTTQFFVPPGTPVVAARDARVWSVDKSARGWQVVLDHGSPFATYYQHLSTVTLPLHAGGKPVAGGAPWQVKAGQVIGTVGGDPLDGAQHLRHLHFAVWYKGNGDSASVDPADAMASWPTVEPWNVT